ncbi:hypothetical protein FF098_000390 [Parvularcula flava]|uniref:Uncharacterized protein n=1 Tax=Aquisalinus luteolus TaxID=1566827 RepID=A0A8J3EPY8_9PROT|nr:hypothetical protein [Aquisalinus luteolus]NHK26360.1 hypothetical protein [Aquisalinus luteolus]GGH92097.1 hypothetical protein GCM10011355_00790 [Aquisalinus luteolus]
MKSRTTILTAAAASLAAITSASAEEAPWQPVSGEGIHYFSTSVKHSEAPTETGAVIRSTDIVSLTGDLTGTVLYHPVTVIDGAAGTLNNSGYQVFSGTVLGGEPVLLLDDSFSFEVLLATGTANGTVILDQTLAGPPTVCKLTVNGDGTMTEDGDSLFTYEGECQVEAR